MTRDEIKFIDRLYSDLYLNDSVVKHTTSKASYDEFYELFYKEGLALIFGLFFIGVTIYGWILFIRNVIIKPKKEIMFLLKIEDDSAVFINRKGKIFYSYDVNHKVENFYYVLKTHDRIEKVLSESTETFQVPKERKSYWLNCYTPMGNFENIFLLPIMYVILLPGLFIFFMSKGFNKIYGAIWSLVPIYAIIYDFIYKIKLKKNNYEKIDESAFHASYKALVLSIGLLAVMIVCGIVFYMFFISDGIGKIFLSPFCLCALCVIGKICSGLLENEKMGKFFYKMYFVIFAIFMLALISITTAYLIMEKNYISLLFMFPFYVALGFVIYNVFLKKN